MIPSAICNPYGELSHIISQGENIRSALRGSHCTKTVSAQGDKGSRQCAIESSGCKWGDACRLNCSVKRCMPRAKPLEVRSVSRLMDVQQRDHKARSHRIAANAACRLNILRAGLRLPKHHHQTQPDNIEPNRDHVRCKRNIDVFLVIKRERKPRLGNRGSCWRERGASSENGC